MGKHDVEDGGDQFAIYLAHRHAAVDDARANRLAGSHIFRIRVQVETREEYLGGVEAVGFCDGHDRIRVIEREVPLGRFVIPAVSHGAAWIDDAAVFFHYQATVSGVGGGVEGGVGKLGSGEELAWGVGAVTVVIEGDEERRIGELTHVVQEVRFLAVHVEGLENDVAHGKGEGGVSARLDAGPLISELGVIREVRRDHHNLGALIAGLDHKVRIRGTGDGDIGAPHHEVGRVVPVTGFRNVGLIAEGLRGRRRQVCIPIVEGQGDAADRLQETHARAIRNLGHRRNHGEAIDAVRAVLADGVHVRGRGNVDGLFIGDADESALAALGDISLALFRVLLDRAPRQDGISVLGLFLAEHVY